MRRLILLAAVLAVVGGTAWVWQRAQARGAEQEGSALEPFGTAGYAALEVRTRAVADGSGGRLVATWRRTAAVGAQRVELQGTLRYADEPVVRTDFQGRRAAAEWTEQGRFGSRDLQVRGEWVEAAATAGALGAEMRATRKLRWGDSEVVVEGQGRVTATPERAEGVYAEQGVVAGLPVLTVVRFALRPTGPSVDLTWTRRTEVGGRVYENTGSYSGPALPLPAAVAPYELLMLLSAAEGVSP